MAARSGEVQRRAPLRIRDGDCPGQPLGAQESAHRACVAGLRCNGQRGPPACVLLEGLRRVRPQPQERLQRLEAASLRRMVKRRSLPPTVVNACETWNEVSDLGEAGDRSGVDGIGRNGVAESNRRRKIVDVEWRINSKVAYHPNLRTTAVTTASEEGLGQACPVRTHVEGASTCREMGCSGRWRRRGVRTSAVCGTRYMCLAIWSHDQVTENLFGRTKQVHVVAAVDEGGQWGTMGDNWGRKRRRQKQHARDKLPRSSQQAHSAPTLPFLAGDAPAGPRRRLLPKDSREVPRAVVDISPIPVPATDDLHAGGDGGPVGHTKSGKGPRGRRWGSARRPERAGLSILSIEGGKPTHYGGVNGGRQQAIKKQWNVEAARL